MTPLTSSELDLLWILGERAGRVVSRELLAALLTGQDALAHGRFLDVRVARLRAKIEADRKRPRRLRTVRGVGYVLVKPAVRSLG